MDSERVGELAAARASALGFYSPYFFLRQFPAEQQQQLFGTGAVGRWCLQPDSEICVVPVAAGDVHWLWQVLPWDSTYFGTPMVRLFTGLFEPEVPPGDLARAATSLREHLAERHGAFYAFSIVPAEDVSLLQALTTAGWRLVETRLTYYRDQLADFQFPAHAVREASVTEAAHIGKIAAAARNPYDRFHADSWCTDEQADAYLARYAENAVGSGLATTVLVPNEPALPVDSFLAISDLMPDATALGTRLSRVLLTAVGPANRGWHLKLVAETLRRAQALGHEAVLMTTQASNPAVFRTAETLGFRLGAVSHVLVCDSR